MFPKFDTPKSNRFVPLALILTLCFFLAATAHADVAVLELCKKNVVSANLIETPCDTPQANGGDFENDYDPFNTQFDDSGELICEFLFWSYQGDYYEGPLEVHVPEGMTHLATAWFHCYDADADPPFPPPSSTFISGLDMTLGEELLSPVVQSLLPSGSWGTCGTDNPCQAGYPLDSLTSRDPVDGKNFDRWYRFPQGVQTIEPESPLQLALYTENYREGGCPFLYRLGYEDTDCNPPPEVTEYELELVPIAEHVTTLPLERVCTQIWDLESCGCFRGYCPPIWAEFDHALLEERLGAIPEILLHDARTGEVVAEIEAVEGTVQIMEFTADEELLEYGVFSFTFPEVGGEEITHETLFSAARTLE